MALPLLPAFSRPLRSPIKQGDGTLDLRLSFGYKSPPRLVIRLVSYEKSGKTIKSTSKQAAYRKNPLCFLAFVDHYTGEFCSLRLRWAPDLPIPRSKSYDLGRFSFSVRFD
ncbi:Uncharacterized protein Fot_56486 [Forsythia ovata]|uniref:Uncharacterized protein n=1 Tax=Forsythia ovata TaxID=205694 RepID=A0ABD1NZN5_9LAMI